MLSEPTQRLTRLAPLPEAFARMDAIANPVPAVDLDGLRRRTRVLMGRCQGFFCGAEVRALLAEAKQQPW